MKMKTVGTPAVFFIFFEKTRALGEHFAIHIVRIGAEKIVH